MSTNKKVLVALPGQLLEALDLVAEHESRTRSDAIREAIRAYLIDFRKKASLPRLETALAQRPYDFSKNVADSEAVEVESEPSTTVKPPIGFAAPGVETLPLSERTIVVTANGYKWAPKNEQQ